MHYTWNYKDYSMEKFLIEYYFEHENDEFIKWKIIRAFQSFNSIRMKNILEKIIMESKNKTMVEEAKRSINRM